MNVGAIVWGGTSLSCLIQAATGLKGVKLTAFSMRQLEDAEEAKKCLVSLRECDVTLLYLGNNEIWEQIKPDIEEIGKTKPVICMSSDPALFKYSTVSADVVKTCYEYLTLGGEENFANMLRFIGNKVLSLNFSVKLPLSFPWEGILHPDTNRVYTNRDDYDREHIQKGIPTVGILFYRCYWINQNMEIEQALIKELERRGLNVIPAFSQSIGKTDFNSKPGYEVAKEYFLDDNGRPVIDAFINLQSSILSPQIDTHENAGIQGGVEFLKLLDIPVFHPLVTYYKTEAEWREDKLGLGSSVGWQLALPEFQGVIEPIIIGAVRRIIDERSGACVERYWPITERVERFVSRVKNWIELKHMPPRERKVAFILHNNPCASVEATVGCGAHLDTLESVARILREMKTKGYAVNPPKDGKELITTIMERKAVSEFRWTTTDEIVKKGGALSFISKNEYLEWF
ncbi:MAG: cobaltochelatase subunit CobN, partial [Candidatus Omnitrophota bacterium]|nr:cobaltochelatase subunit CobN [Candidatus Omnitrophota bacterium]